MNIGIYTYEEFKERVAGFHGYPAPGVLIGGYMVELAKGRLPEGTLFDAIVETPKCLPDAVQLLTLCSIGNGWMKIFHLGRYALSLYDKYTGEGVRVWIDPAKLSMWPEIRTWFFKEKPKKEQDSAKLFDEIRRAGASICSIGSVQIQENLLRKSSFGRIVNCPICHEAYPARFGAICRGCQGEAPYLTGPGDDRPSLASVPVQEAVGRTALHDMTRIEPEVSKEPAFSAGQQITAGDVCRLQRMGRNRLYVQEAAIVQEGWVHENDAVLAFAESMAGQGVAFDPRPREGKINFTAERDGLFVVDLHILEAFNLIPDVMCATRQSHSVVSEGRPLAGTRAIPLYILKERFDHAVQALEAGEEYLLSVLPMRSANVGILVTGTEVYQGLIEDKFIPVIKRKVEKLGCRIAGTDIVPDDEKAVAEGTKNLMEAGADLIVTTAGLSVDPEDVTRQGLMSAGLTDMLYGAPVLPGTMLMLGRIGTVQVVGVPACALFFKTTSFDLVLPRLLADLPVTRLDLARFAEGGFCLNCRTCTFPKCPFGK